MDINLAKTFLTVADCGSFIEAARRMNLTQSTVSARIKTLEDLIGRPLFDRSKSGATLSGAGVQFQKHAIALVRVWTHAQVEIGLAGSHRDHLGVGAEATLWDGFLLRWVASLRASLPDIAVSGSTGGSTELMQRLIEGALDLAIMYRPTQLPGLLVEHLFDEEFVLVSSQRPQARRGPAEVVSVDWGPDVQLDASSGMPDVVRSGLNLDIGSLALDYLLAQSATGYFPLRLVKPHLARGRLRVASKGRRFVAPVGMVYPEARDVEAYEPILAALRREAKRHA